MRTFGNIFLSITEDFLLIGINNLLVVNQQILFHCHFIFKYWVYKSMFVVKNILLLHSMDI